MAKPHFPTKADPAGQLLFAASLAMDLIEITAYGLCKALEDYERETTKTKKRSKAKLFVISGGSNVQR